MTWIYNHIALLLEISAVIFGVIYVILAAKNRISCWFFGIIGSLISICFFYIYLQLYAEALLYTFYVFAGVYGWVTWGKQENKHEAIKHSFLTHIKIIGVGVLFSVGLFFLIDTNFPEAERPLIDSFTTIFSFIATYLTAKKWLSNWLYWIFIDLVSTYLYFSRGAELYATLMLAYSFIAVYGYFKWKKLSVVKA